MRRTLIALVLLATAPALAAKIAYRRTTEHPEKEAARLGYCEVTYEWDKVSRDDVQALLAYYTGVEHMCTDRGYAGRIDLYLMRSDGGWAVLTPMAPERLKTDVIVDFRRVANQLARVYKSKVCFGFERPNHVPIEIVLKVCSQ